MYLPGTSSDSLTLPSHDAQGFKQTIHPQESVESLSHNRPKSSGPRKPSVSDWDLPSFASSNNRSDMLVHSYMICGANTDPTKWTLAPLEEQSAIVHRHGAVHRFWRPEVLRTSPSFEENIDLRRTSNAAVSACYPHYFEICAGPTPPVSTHHNFILRRSKESTLYGTALQVWTHANKRRTDMINKILKEGFDPSLDQEIVEEQHYWVPATLCLLSKFPFYDLYGDFLRQMWQHWRTLKQVHQAHSEEIARILKLQAPRLGSMLKLDLPHTTLSYKIPNVFSDIQNFQLWPLFSCLPLKSIITLVEVALSSSGRIIFISRHLAMLNVAAETIRYLVRLLEWNGLYIPTAHVHHCHDLIYERSPYILGFSSTCRGLINPPNDAHVVDLDTGILHSSTFQPTVLTPSQRLKLVNRLAKALNGLDNQHGVPSYLQASYEDGKAFLTGTALVKRENCKVVNTPTWWDQEAVVAIFDRVCKKISKNASINSIFSGSSRKHMKTTVPISYVDSLIRDRNASSREVREIWQEMLMNEKASHTQVLKVSRKCNFLVGELDRWKSQFEHFQEINELLTSQKRDLHERIVKQTKERDDLVNELQLRKDEIDRLRVHLSGTERQRDEALSAIVQQQIITEELERRRNKTTKELSELETSNRALTTERDDAQRVLEQLSKAMSEEKSQKMREIVQAIRKEEPLFDQVQSRLSGTSDSTSWPSLAASSSISTDDSPSPRRLTMGKTRYSQPRTPSLRARSAPITRRRLETPPFKEDNSTVNRVLFERRRTSPSIPILPYNIHAEDDKIREKIASVGEIIRKITEQYADGDSVALGPSKESFSSTTSTADTSMTGSQPPNFSFDTSIRHYEKHRASFICPTISTPALSQRSSRSSLFDTAQEALPQESISVDRDSSAWSRTSEDVAIDEPWNYVIDEIYCGNNADLYDPKLSQNPWVLCSP